MKSVRRNAAINVGGSLIPMLAAVLAMPVLFAGLGASRMGLFTLVLGLFGFAGLFDLGLGRALTRTVAFHDQAGTPRERIAPLLRTGLASVLLLGLGWGAAIWAGGDLLLARLPGMSPALADESRAALAIVAAMIPVALLSTGLTGVLEGLQHFPRSNAVRMPVGVASFVIPAAVAHFTPSLVMVVGGLAIVRLAGMVALLVIVAAEVPMGAKVGPRPLAAGPMWRYTGWLTVSNIVGPLMVYGDRYFLAAFLPAAIVGYYTVPLDTLFRATAIPAAALAASFPALAKANSDDAVTAQYLSDSEMLLTFAWLTPVLATALLLPDLLSLWLGPAHAGQMLTTSRVILFGVLLNGFALVPFTLLQAVGRTDVTARFHVVELPLFAAALVLLVPRFGIVGAAVAWSLRVGFDAGCLWFAAGRLFPAQRHALLAHVRWALAGGATVIAAGVIGPTAIRVLLAGGVLVAATLVLHRRGGFSWLLQLARPGQ